MTIKGYVLIDAGNGFDPENLFDSGGRGERLDTKGYRFYVNKGEADMMARIANSQDCNITVYEAMLEIVT